MPEYIGHSQHSRSLNIHCIFSTKGRAPMLNPELRERLWPFLGGIAKQNGITPRCIGGVADHVHLLLSWPTTVPIAKAIQLVKAGSSAWIDQTFYSLSLWDKSHSPIEAPHNYLSAYGVTPRGLHCLASYLRSSSSSSFVLVRISGGTSESPAACFLYA